MANFAVTDVVTKTGTLELVAAALETAIEAVDDGKTIRLLEIHHIAGNQFQGVFIHDA
jgi:F420-dependent methylenetetrahydromethanopterin dehydrogenase